MTESTWEESALACIRWATRLTLGKSTQREALCHLCRHPLLTAESACPLCGSTCYDDNIGRDA